MLHMNINIEEKTYDNGIAIIAGLGVNAWNPDEAWKPIGRRMYLAGWEAGVIEDLRAYYFTLAAELRMEQREYNGRRAYSSEYRTNYR